jgi:outer membrane protein
MRLTPITTCIALSAALVAGQASADTFSARIGAHSVNPKSNNGQLAGLDADVSDEVGITGGVSWMITPNISTDLWLGLDGFRHDVRLAGAGPAFGVGTDTVASVRHRPVTLGVNYHFGSGAFRPFLGLGYNWIRVSGERGVGALEGAEVSASNASGLTYTLGADFDFNDFVFLRVDARRLDFDTDVSVPALGGPVGTVNVDPWVYGVSIGFRF